MSETPSELLIAAEVARWFRLTSSTVYAWAAMGKIPCVKMNGAIRFVRSDLERWIQDRSCVAPDPAPSKIRPILPPQMATLSRGTMQRAGARAIRQILKRHLPLQNASSGLVLPTAGVGEPKETR